MNLETRKYNLIQGLINVNNEEVVSELELVLDKHKADGISVSHKKILDNRLRSYKDNPENVLDWNDVKNDW